MIPLCCRPGIGLATLASLWCGEIGAARADTDANALISSSVRIFCKSAQGLSSGSGFVVGKDGKFVLTNSHVASNCDAIAVMSPRDSGDPKQTTATVVWDSKTSVSKRYLDAALLSLAQSVDRPGVDFANKKTVALRDPVIAVGYPGAADGVGTLESAIKPTITQGHVSRILTRRPDGEDSGGNGVGLYQITASIGPGSSGGPLFNEYGEVIGINTEKALIRMATITDQGNVGLERVPLMDGVAWSQEIDELLPILQERGIGYHLTTERRNWFWSWLSREPVTAAALGGVAVLLLVTLSAFVLRLPGFTANLVPGGGWHLAKAEQSAVSKTTPHAVGLAGPYSGSRFPLDADLVFGRDLKLCNVVFSADADGISSRHCSLRFDAAANAFELRDFGSTNGTFVDGKRVSSSVASRLRDGDEFYLFKREYRFAVRSGLSKTLAAHPTGRG